MICKYRDLEIGEAVVLNANECTCGSCYHNFGFVRFARYMGHSRGMDGFELVNPISCPNCGEEIVIYGVPCVSGTLEA